jgi:two-component system, OmpR family, sensor histidine kinase QseC
MNSHKDSCFNGTNLDVNSIVTDGAHEVRSQLAVLLLELGKIDHPNARQLETDIQLTSATVNRIAILFKLATTDTLSLKNMDVADVLQNAVRRAVLDDRNRSHLIECKLSCTSCVIQGNAPFLSEAIYGLIDNAVRHSPAGTRVVVGFSTDHVVSIDDDGPGLPTTVACNFGQPFGHGRARTSGPGLGLALAVQVARLHNGRCFAAPSKLGGTQVCFSLMQPLAEVKIDG